MINFFNRGVDSGFAAPTMGHMSALKEPTNTDLMQAILRLQSDMAGQQSDMGSLRSDIASMQTDIASLRSDMASMQTDIASLRSDMASMRQDLHNEIVAQSAYLKEKIVEQGKALEVKTEALDTRIKSVEKRLHSEIVELRLDIKAVDAKVDKLAYELRSEAHGQTEEIYAFMEAQETDFIESMQETKESFREEIKFTNALESEERRVMKFDLHKLGKRVCKLEKAILPT